MVAVNSSMLLTGGVALAVLAHKLVQLRHDRANPALRAICAALACLSATTVLNWQPAQLLIGPSSDIAGLCRLLADVLTLCAAAAVQSMVLHIFDPSSAHRRFRIRLALVAAATVVIVSLRGTLGIGDPHHPADLTAQSAAYLGVWLAVLGFAAMDVLRLTVPYARRIPSTYLRLGLRLLTAGAVAGLFYSAHLLVTITLARVDLAPMWPELELSRVFAVSSVLLVTTGLSAPSACPYVLDVARWLGQYRVYRDLEPLWLAIYRANRAVILSPPLRRPSVRTMHAQLDRRVIEIHDGLRGLRPYLSADARRRSPTATAAEGVTPADAVAASQAAAIVAAMARMTPSNAATARGMSVAGNDLCDVDLKANAAALARVSRALAANPNYGTGREGWIQMPQRPMTLAGELYLIAHDERTGKPRLHQRATDVALAAALLAELLFLDLIYIEGTRLVAVGRRAPDDHISRKVWEVICGEEHPLRVWLEFLALGARADVIQRLHDSGTIAPTVSRHLFRPVTVWTPTDPNAGAWSWARLSVSLGRHEDLGLFDATLAGLIHAAELDPIVIDGAPRSVRDHLEHIVQRTWQPVADLLAETRALIGTDVLAHRM